MRLGTARGIALDRRGRTYGKSIKINLKLFKIENEKHESGTN